MTNTVSEVVEQMRKDVIAFRAAGHGQWADCTEHWADRLSASRECGDAPKVVLELPDGDGREAKVRWTEWKNGSLHLCISVSQPGSVAVDEYAGMKHHHDCPLFTTDPCTCAALAPRDAPAGRIFDRDADLDVIARYREPRIPDIIDQSEDEPRTRPLTNPAEVRQAQAEGLRVEFSRRGNTWHGWAWLSEDYARWFAEGRRARAVLP